MPRAERCRLHASVGAWLEALGADATLRRLNELAYLPKSAYEARVLGPITFGVCVAGNGVLAALLVAALVTTRH